MASEIQGEGPIDWGSVERGVWCAHNVKILEADPESRLEYPPLVPIEPWPCSDCTWEDFQRDEAEMEEEYYRERWQEYISSQGFGYCR